VAQDYVKAREWFEKAVDKGDAGAMFNLARLYENGRGVTQDYVKAREWYEKAVDKGDAEAKAQLEQLPIREAVGAGRYTEALQLQEALAVTVEEAETKREGNPAKETAQVRPVCSRFHESVDRRQSRARPRSGQTVDRNQPGTRTYVPGTRGSV
jgi:hypothetical protein